MANLESSAARAMKKLARELLTTTCLTAVAAGAGQAATFNESTLPDFNNTFASANTLPGGTDVVLGSISPSSDNDFFQFTGLLGGGTYTLSGIYEGAATYQILNSAGGVLNTAVTNPASFTGTIPGDGILVVGVTQNEQVALYDLTLSAPTAVPEPSTAAAVALALAGGLALRRKLAK